MNYSRARKLVKLKKSLGQTKGLRFIDEKLFKKTLWRPSYGSVARALMIGLFWMMIPMPFQMVPTVIMSVYLRANIPIAIICVWISNPITWLPIYFANYIFGSFLLGLNINIVDWRAYANYVMQNIEYFWRPLYLGSIVGGLILGSIAFLLVYLIKFLRRG
ncbi:MULTISPECIES: DUF2062 domain-containing protein [unclassified Francisella]|uniref:DUF2062 domain-containing protein n=1 Tax=unclassified Francisella TaxID=2610885 RepID=UPI002E37EA12|nr:MULTISPECIES: DUF2062 domain-containing protein [unclassified Francisella]MED7819679.1 DUF2062 domain-containing protein [Francisella sp. 19S2-4]MED7830499.1 DUF2062 domain-containing protein [Francisella sp. 19S2-10]